MSIQKTEHSSGFGAVIIAAVLMVALLVSGAGYIVFRNKHKATNALSTGVISNPSPSPTPVSVGGQPAQPAQQYLVISEWGVSAPYNGNGDTLTYTLSADKKTANIGSKLMASKDPTCTNRGAGLVQRFASDEKADIAGTKSASQLATENNGRYVLVNGYYYQYMHAQSACGSVSLADQNTANDLVKAAIAKLQASK